MKDSRAPREIELILRCARTAIDATQSAHISRLVEEQIDWEYVSRVAIRHGVASLLFKKLSVVCPEITASPALSALKNHSRLNAARNMLLAGELLKVLSLFARENIEAIAFKGPALAAAVYGDLTLRQFADLDILIREHDIARAQRHIIEHGYRPQFDLRGAQETAFVSAQHGHAFWSADRKFSIDLHWDLTQNYFSFSLPIGELWARRREVALLGATVNTFAPEDMLLVLCAHGTKSLWLSLKWVCDVAELVNRHTDMDWERVRARAQSAGGERMLALGLRLAHDLLEARVPSAVISRLSDCEPVGSLVARVRAELFREHTIAPGIAESARFHLTARERLADRVRYCVRLAATPNVGDLQLLRLPASLAFVYYLMRPFRLLNAYRQGGTER